MQDRPMTDADRAAAHEARIARMAERWAAGQDIYTGRPLRGRDRADWRDWRRAAARIAASAEKRANPTAAIAEEAER